MARDEAGFEAFVHAHLPSLLGFALLLTGQRSDAEDLVQIALGRALDSWPRVRDTDRPDAYVRRIIANTNVSRFRRAHHRRELLVAEPPDHEGPVSDLHVIDERQALRTALAELPPRQRAVVVLRFVEDRTEADVADILGISVGTVKSQAHKGLARLRTNAALAPDVWSTS